MATDILMPKMGESVQEGTILRWLKKPGDVVERDEIIAEISTDKVDTEIPSPAAGTLLEIVAQENETVGVGAVIARLGAENETAAAPAAPAPAAPAPAPPSAAKPETASAAAESNPAAPPEKQPGQTKVASSSATPAAAASAPSASAPAASAPAATAPAATVAAGATGERIEILMPKMGESVQEGTILRWLKQPGDTIERDEVMAEISTDKVDTEIPSPIAGTLAEIVAQENQTVDVGAVIAYMTKEGAAAAASSGAARKAPSAQPAASQPAAPAPAAQPQAAPAIPPAPQSVPATNGSASQPVAAQYAASSGPVPRKSGDRFYSPLVRSIADKEGIGVQELDALAGSGSGGRVTKVDLLAYVSSRGSRPAAAPQTAAQPAGRAATQPAQVTGTKDYGPDVEVVPMDRMRQLIAEHMVRSKHTSPHVTEVGEADVTPLVRLREGTKDEFKKQNGVNLTYTAFFIAAIARALRENPWVNASVDGTNIIVKKHVNVGVATALPDGNLIVPVIKDADRMNVAGIAFAVNDLATRARSKQLSPDEIAGGTFTLTNYGVFGLLHGAPIISQPQLAILGTGAIQKRPVVREFEGNDVIAIRSMVYLSLSHDHRVIDGLLGGKFLSDVIKHLESFNEESAI